MGVRNISRHIHGRIKSSLYTGLLDSGLALSALTSKWAYLEQVPVPHAAQAKSSGKSRPHTTPRAPIGPPCCVPDAPIE